MASTTLRNSVGCGLAQAPETTGDRAEGSGRIPVAGEGPIPRPGDAAPTAAAQAAPAPARRTLPAVLDPELAERPARACSGWRALTAALLAAAGAALLARYTGPRVARRLRPARAHRPRRAAPRPRRPRLDADLPLPRHARLDVRLRHWRSEPLCVVDAEGTALRAVVLVVWRVKDTVRALLAVEDHGDYLRGQAESATARVFSRMPADSFRPPHGAEPFRPAAARRLRPRCRGGDAPPPDRGHRRGTAIPSSPRSSTRSTTQSTGCPTAGA